MKEKKCKGLGKAQGHGCGNLSCFRQLGLCPTCFKTWLYTTDEGMERIKKASFKATKTRIKTAKATKKDVELYRKEYIKDLQREVNKLARMIDQKHGYSTCIDCGKEFGKQIDAGHFHSTGSNPSIRFNLHNIHSQASHCNRNGLGGGKQLGYMRGLQKRYSESYAERIEFELPKQYPHLKLTGQDVWDAIVKVRELIRNFDKHETENAVQAREYMNELIGIYKNTKQ